MLQLLLNGFVLGLVASPTCPSNAEEIKFGTRYGFISALSVGLGAVVGDALVLLVIWLGLYPLIERYELASTALWFLGATVLAYVAWGIFREISMVTAITGADNQEQADLATLSRAFWIGLSITTFNPFTALWWLGLIGPTFATNQTIPNSFCQRCPRRLVSLVHAALAFVYSKLAKTLAHTKRCASGYSDLAVLIVVGYALFFVWKRR